MSFTRIFAVAVIIGFFGPLSGLAIAGEVTATGEILQILQDRGLINEAEHMRLLAKQEKESRAAMPKVASALSKMELYGDLRLRYESFRYQHDATGIDRTDRDRLRYRARLGFKVPINDWIKVGMRFAGGSDDPRSTNKTLGSGTDLDTDDFRFDRAYAEIKLPTGGLKTKFVGGKMSNPFRWKVGKDILVWDSDITPEGGALKFSYAPAEGWELFTNVAYYVIDENSSSSDPKVIPVQAGFHADLNEAIQVGARSSMYWWRALDSRFLSDAEDFGNLCSAFDACISSDDGTARVGEVSAYFRFNGMKDWPTTVYATGVKNFTADSAVIGGDPVSDEDTAWLIGVEIGDKKKLAKFGFAYAKVEANSVISWMYDSDLFDGLTNRQGWVAYVSKSVLPHTDANVTLFKSNDIEGSSAFMDSVENAQRFRIQTDLVLKF